MAVSWEEKFNEIENKYNLLQNDYNTVQAKLSEYVNTTKSSNSPNDGHNFTFWKRTKELIMTQPEAIKAMIKNKELSLTETDHERWTILCWVAAYGDYQLAQFCM